MLLRSTALLALLLALLPAESAAQMPDTTLWFVKGAERAVRVGNTLYVCGRVSGVGPQTGCALPFDAATSEPRQPHVRVSGRVNAIAADGSGGWFVGGVFQGINGAPRRNLAHLLADGTLAAWAPEPDSEVFALVRVGGTLYAGGRFEHIGGEARMKLAAVDVVSGAATPFDAAIPMIAPNAWPHVDVLAYGAGVLYVGGGFNSIGGQPRNILAALDAATAAATPWNPAMNGFITALEVSGNSVYVAGGFLNIAGSPRRFLAELSAATGAATAWDPSPDVVPYAFAVSGNTLYVGGGFGTIAGQSRTLVAAFDRTSGALLPFAPNVSNTASVRIVQGLAVAAGALYLVGEFSHVNGSARNGAAAVNATTGGLQAFDPRVDTPPSEVGISGSEVFLAGAFASAGFEPRSGLCALDLSTGRATPFAPQFDGRVYDLATDGSKLWAGGFFTNVNGQFQKFLARFSLPGGTLDTWAPFADNAATTLVLSGTRLDVGGYPGVLGGHPFTGPTLGAVDASNANNLNWWPATVGGPVNRISLEPDGSAANVASQGGLWRFSSATAGTLWSAPFTDGPYYTVLQSGGRVFAGGGFRNVGGSPRHGAAAFDPSTGALLAWDPDANDRVTDLASDGVHVYAAGWFTGIGGAPRRGLAALDPATGAATSYDYALDGAVNQLLVAGADVFAFGDFRSAGNHAAPGLARLRVVPPLGVDPAPGPRPLAFSARPSPAVARTTLRYALPLGAHVSVAVFDTQGRVVARPLDEWQEAGEQGLTLETTAWPAGVYLVRLTAGAESRTLRLAKLR